MSEGWLMAMLVFIAAIIGLRNMKPRRLPRFLRIVRVRIAEPIMRKVERDAEKFRQP